jgi:citrate lyase subunit beta/citryl-CoA lyase
MRILRTLLYVPGNRPRMIDKAVSTPADAVILDLEDSVPTSEKESARTMVASAIGRFASTRPQVFVRVNSLFTPYAAADIEETVIQGLCGVLLPKSESAEEIRRVDQLISEREKEAGLRRGSIGVLALVETARAVMRVCEIISASARVLGVAFGAEDYAIDLGVGRAEEGTEMSYPRMVIPVACHAANVQAIDCVCMDVRDTEGLIREARHAKQLGFQGKQVVHPSQVIPVNEVFTPSPQEIEYARRVVGAFETAVRQGYASTSLDGKLVDVPVAERARRLLAQYEAITEAEKQK